MTATTLSRRVFCLAALVCLGPARRVRAEGPPAPRVARLSDWRAAPALARLEKAFAYLEKATLDDMAPGRHPIDGDRMYLTVARGPTRDPGQARFEAHRKYIDVHYLIRGREMIGSAPADGLREAGRYGPEDDVQLFEVPRQYQRLRLSPGDFVVFFPGQGHLPGCHDDRPGELHKAVVKVLAGSL